MRKTWNRSNPIPGVSAITSALSVSGFKDQFLFYGFLPKTENELTKILTTLSKIHYTQVFFAPAKKVNFYIQNFKSFIQVEKYLLQKKLLKFMKHLSEMILIA